MRSFLCALVFVAGCSNTTARPTPPPIVVDVSVELACPSRSYTVVVDGRMSAAWQDASLQAADAWGRALGGAFHFDASVVAAQPAVFRPCTISLVSGDALAETWGDNERQTGPDGTLGSAVVWLDDARDDGSVSGIAYATALHELGHVLGLQHVTDKTACTAMWPFITVPGHVGSDDQRAACAVWGCDGSALSAASCMP